MVTNALFKYYTLNWLAMAFSFIAVYLMGNQKRVGFVSFMVANLCWIVVGFMVNSIAIAIGNTGFFCLNLSGFWQRSNAAKCSR
ncbi:MAG: PnuC protein [Verrucomicrobia bacterium]|nr:PnuC protein [Leptolyngbya sp. ES-bin-22]